MQCNLCNLLTIKLSSRTNKTTLEKMGIVHVLYPIDPDFYAKHILGPAPDALLLYTVYIWAQMAQVLLFKWLILWVWEL